MHSILIVQRISHRCATDTVYRTVTTEEGRAEAQILRCSDQTQRLTSNWRLKITTTESRNTEKSSNGPFIMFKMYVSRMNGEAGWQ